MGSQCGALVLDGPHALFQGRSSWFLQIADHVAVLPPSFVLSGSSLPPASVPPQIFPRDVFTFALHPWNSCLSSSFQDCLSSFKRVRKSSNCTSFSSTASLRLGQLKFSQVRCTCQVVDDEEKLGREQVSPTRCGHRTALMHNQLPCPRKLSGM